MLCEPNCFDKNIWRISAIEEHFIERKEKEAIVKEGFPSAWREGEAG